VGQELRCTVRFGDRVSEGKALLETDELVFRGVFRLTVPFKTMRSVEALNGDLRITFPDGSAIFELGEQAEKWAQKILHPKSLLDKLGVKPSMKIGVVGVIDATFVSDLRERADDVTEGPPTADSDMIFIAVDGPGDLKELASLKGHIQPNGTIWAVFRKGQKEFNENDVLRGGLAAGLVDVKVVRFSDTHTASRFVIRKSER
jgi:hypothetical protein